MLGFFENKDSQNIVNQVELDKKKNEIMLDNEGSKMSALYN